MGLEDVLTPFVILAIGSLIALFAFCIEKFIVLQRRRLYRKYLSTHFLYS
jgi:hypothetical protein